MTNGIDQLQPGHVAAGLGGANREFLSVCLGVFDDARVLKRLKNLFRMAFNKWTPIRDLVSARESVESSAKKWELDDKLTDEHLRAILWIRLQRALAVYPSITRSVRGCERLADDLVASGLKDLDASASKGLVGRALENVGEQGAKLWRNRKNLSKSLEADGSPAADAVPSTLAALVEPLLSKMVQGALGDGADAMGEENKHRLVVEIVAALGEDERRAILDEAGEQDIGRAVCKSIAAGGVHGTFGATVAVSGFAPYIFAAQASAFIPFVSGPALVSLVSVLANPVVVVAAVAGLGLYWNRSANERAAAQVAIHLIALLACDGLGRGREALENLVGSFRGIPELAADVFTDRDEESTYKELWHEMEATSWLAAPAPRPALADPWERKDVYRDSVAIAAASIGDLIYSLAAIDPQVVAAADFSRSDEIDNPFDFAAHFFEKFESGWGERKESSVAEQGDIAQLKGFTMEQIAATKLVDDGHVVEMPVDPNQPGWDLMVDGQPFQVKCLADSSLLNEHFARYPDIPVLANSDLIDEVEQWPEEWRESVFFLEGHTEELVEQVVARSYAEAKDLGDNDVPEIALAYVAARQLWRLKKGEVTRAQAASQLLIEGTTRAGLAVAGAIVGQSVGLLLLGPAGALIATGVLPILAQAGAGPLVGRVKNIVGLRSKVHEEVDVRCRALCVAVERAIDDKLSTLRLKHRQVGNGAAGAYVRHRLMDEARHLEESQGRLLALRQDGRDRPTRVVETLRIALQAVHPARFQPELRGLLATPVQ